MGTVKTSRHARVRQAGRAISDRAIKTVMEFGRCFWAGRGCRAFFVGRRDAREDNTLADFQNIAVIVASDGTVVTVEHCDKPPRHWKRAGESARLIAVQA
jgi:hypothetical protein